MQYRFRYFLLFIFLFAGKAFPQFSDDSQRNIDSLSLVIKKNPSSLDAAAAYVDLSDILYLSNIDTVIPLCLKALAITDAYLNESSPEKKKLVLKTRALALNNIGFVYDNFGATAKALDYYLQSLKIRETINDRKGIAESYNNIGVIYKKLGNITKALEYYQNGLAIEKEDQNKKGIALALNNMAVAYDEQNNGTKALENYLLSLKINEEIDNKEGIGNLQYNVGVIYFNDGNIKDALSFYEKSFKVMEEIGDKRGMSTSLCAIAKIKLEQNKLAEAIGLAEHSLKLAQELGFPSNIINSSHLLYKINTGQGNWKEALKMHELYTQMQDSLLNEENTKKIVQSEMNFEFEQKEATAKLEQEKKEVITSAERKKQKIIIWSVSGILLLVFAFAVFVYRSYLQKQKANIEISKQKHFIEEKQKEILDSIDYAKRLQQAILPNTEEIKKHLPESFIYYQPKDIVAGDFYWMEKISRQEAGESRQSIQNTGDYIFIAAADSTGHGVPGAMVSVVCSNALNRAVKEFGLRNTGEILDKTRELVIETFEKSDKNVKDGMDISLLRIDQQGSGNLAGLKVQWSGANNSLWYFQNNELSEIKANKQPIGKYNNPVPFITHTKEFNSSVSFYLFSDGYADQFSSNDKKLMTKKFKEVLSSIQQLPMQEQGNQLEKFHIDWKGNMEQTDDVLVIGIRFA